MDHLVIYAGSTKSSQVVRTHQQRMWFCIDAIEVRKGSDGLENNIECTQNSYNSCMLVNSRLLAYILPLLRIVPNSYTTSACNIICTRSMCTSLAVLAAN